MKQTSLEDAKKVSTFNLKGQENGFLVELFKDGRKTTAYLSAVKPGAFKGYHLHRVRAARYVCLKGKMKIMIYEGGKRQEFILSADKPQRLFIPAGVPTGLLNIGDSESWLINLPDPAYDPNLKDEQVDYTQAEVEEKFT